MKWGEVYTNRKMIAPRVLPTFEECWEKDMTKVQREVFLIVDEWWKEFGYSPSLRDIAYQRGKSSLPNTMKIVNRLLTVWCRNAFLLFVDVVFGAECINIKRNIHFAAERCHCNQLFNCAR